MICKYKVANVYFTHGLVVCYNIIIHSEKNYIIDLFDCFTITLCIISTCDLLNMHWKNMHKFVFRDILKIIHIDHIHVIKSVHKIMRHQFLHGLAEIEMIVTRGLDFCNVS